MKVINKQKNSHDCLVCGMDNPLGVKARFYEMEDGSLIALFSFKKEHQSYPSRTHGGMIAALIDETIGRLVWIKEPEQMAVTMRLSIEYHHPVPYETPLRCVAHFTSNKKMTFEGAAEIQTMKGEMLARGTALYFRLPTSQTMGGIPLTKENENFLVPDDIKDIGE